MSQPVGPSHAITNTTPVNVVSLPSYSPTSATLPGNNDERNAARNNKARNKLGYHRSSVACGHCRRRKIRCKVESKSTHGRCESCIKLKRECEFQPVDLLPEPTTGKSNGAQQGKPKNRIIASSKIRSTSSSPAVKHELPNRIGYNPYPGLPTMMSCQSMGPPTLKHYNAGGMHAERTAAENVNGSRHPMGYNGWMGSEPASPKHGSGPGFPMGSWKQCAEEPSGVAGYSHFSPQTHQHPTEWPQAIGNVASGPAQVRVEDEWDNSMHSPSRTLSYGSEDSAAPHYVMLAGHDPHRGSFDRRSSMSTDVYTPAAVPSSMASPVEAHHAQVSIGSSSRHPSMAGSPYPWQEQQPYPYASKPNADYSPGWYVNNGSHNHGNGPYHHPQVMKSQLDSNQHLSHGIPEAHYYPGEKRV